MLTVDCRNMACPAPVIAVKKALEHSSNLTVLLDDGAPRENVTRFCRNRGYHVSEEPFEGGKTLCISGTGNATPSSGITLTYDCTLLIASDRLGDGPEDLGKLLMKNFIHTLLETPSQPAEILFINSGVRLECKDSDVIEALEKLVGMGVEISSCGLCLDFFSIREFLQVGSVTNMLTIAETLLTRDRVVKL